MSNVSGIASNIDGSRLALAVFTPTNVPAGIVTPVDLDVVRRDRGRPEDHRAEAACTPRRRRGASSGRSASIAHWSGWSQNTCTAAASWLRVVSVPASSTASAIISSSSWVSRSPSSSAAISADSRSSRGVAAPCARSVARGRRRARRTPARWPGRPRCDVEVEDLERVVGPGREQRPVLGGRAEQLADDGDRVGPGDVGDEVARPVRSTTASTSSVEDRDHRGAQPLGGPGREGLGRRGGAAACGRSPSRLRMPLTTRSQIGPEVMPWISSVRPGRRQEAAVAQHGLHLAVAERPRDRTACGPANPARGRLGVVRRAGSACERRRRTGRTSGRSSSVEHRSWQPPRGETANRPRRQAGPARLA